MFGSFEEWFYRSLLGINPLTPGFEKFIIKPQPAGDLTWAKGGYKSIRGNIISDWRKEGSSFLLHVVIPANTTAVIYIPSKENAAITESNNVVKPLRYEDGYTVIETGSGEYNFLVK
jgi:alpha-L-rhamnosidase